MPTEADKVFRDFVRYAGDGKLPATSAVHTLPIGDPASGVHNPRKADTRNLLNGYEAPIAAATGTPHYASLAAAASVTVPAFAQTVLVDRTVYRRVAGNPFHSRSFVDQAGVWFDGVHIPTSGPVELMLAIGQSEMLGASGTPGGDRSVKDGVLVYEVSPRAGQLAGWHVAGPEDAGWPILSDAPGAFITGSAAYRAAAERAKEIGGLVCLLINAQGGIPMAEFMPSGGGVSGATGTMWAKEQILLTAALDQPLPGRGAMTLRTMGKTTVDHLHIWQGSADADYKSDPGNPGYDTRSSTGPQFIARWNSVIDERLAPGGSSVPVINAKTKIIWYEMLHGATSGAAPGVGYPTDDRNTEVRLMPFNPLVTMRANMRVVPMDGINRVTLNGNVIGSDDNLHPNGAAYDEIGMRAAQVMRAFDVAHAPDVYGSNANGHYIKYANGVLECWSNNIGSVGCTVASGVAFTSGDVSWPFPEDFIDNPVFIPTSDGASNRWATPSGATGTTGTARVLSLVSSATALPVKGYAKGRWR